MDAVLQSAFQVRTWNRWYALMGALLKTAPRRDAQQLCSTKPHEPPHASPLALVQCPATRGCVGDVVAGIPRWHARGQGFKSPQLHQAQRIGSTPTQGRLSADCQQITPCGGNNALSVARFRRLQAILTRRGFVVSKGGRVMVVGRLQQRTWTLLTTATPNPRSRFGRGAGPSLRWTTATATPVPATRSAGNSTGYGHPVRSA